MRFVAGAMMVGFVLAGLAVLITSTREFVRRLMSHRRFERTEGIVVSVQHKVSSMSGSGRSRSTVMHFPVITFSTRSGKVETFTSETGDSGTVSRYAPEQRLAIRYDPDGEFVPMLDSWSGVWLTNLIGMFAGVVFIAGGLMIYWVFWDKIIGR